MTREEQIVKAAKQRADQYSHPSKWSDTYYGFIDGAKWADETMIEKACKWLREYLGAPAGIPQAKSYNDAINKLTTEFRKGMEE